MSFNYDGILQKLTEAPDGQLAQPLADRCRAHIDGNTEFEDPVLFLADLRDRAVHTGGASVFVMHLFSLAVEGQGHKWEDIEQRLEDHPASHRSQYYDSTLSEDISH